SAERPEQHRPRNGARPRPRRAASLPPPMDRTLILVKPDAFARGLTGEIIARFERKGLRIVALKHMQMDKDLASQHYAEHEGKPPAVEGSAVLACDTEVNVDGVVFGKPADGAEARHMLDQLSGRPHEVLGGLVLRCTSDSADPVELSAIASTVVHFRDLERGE